MEKEIKEIKIKASDKKNIGYSTQKSEMNDFVKANYHAHTYRCQHAYDTEREYVEAAIEMGIQKFGFSDHIPCPFKDGYVSGIRMTMAQAEEYVTCIRNLQEEYKDRIQLFVGFEAEYIPEFYEEQKKMFEQLKCDYMIMGQHFLKSEAEGPYMGRPTEDEELLKAYVDAVIEGMETGSYAYLAHPDLMNYQGKEEIYKREMSRLCQSLKEMKIPLEINILGMGEGKHYPAMRFWEIAAEVGNEVILGLDAHFVKNVKDVESYRQCMDMVHQLQLNLINELQL